MEALADALVRSPADALNDLLDELRGKNFVRVTKYQAVSRRGARTIRRRVMDEMGEATPNVAALVLHDVLRAAAGKKPVYVAEALRRVGGELRSLAPNLRTNAGIDFCAAQLLGTPVAAADYIALSNNTMTPGATDTSATHPWDVAQAVDPSPGPATGEYTALGLARKQATYAHTSGVASCSMAATWTATSPVTSVRLAGLFGGAGKAAQGSGATNILALENTFTPTSLLVNDALSLLWTITI